MLGKLIAHFWEYIPKDFVTLAFWGGIAFFLALYVFGRFFYRPYLLRNGRMPTDEERRQLIDDALYPEAAVTRDHDEVLDWLERTAEDQTVADGRRSSFEE